MERDCPFQNITVVESFHIVPLPTEIMAVTLFKANRGEKIGDEKEGDWKDLLLGRRRFINLGILNMASCWMKVEAFFQPRALAIVPNKNAPLFPPTLLETAPISFQLLLSYLKT